MDRFEGKDLQSRMIANSIVYDTLHNWQLQDYTITYFGERQEMCIRDSYQGVNHKYDPATTEEVVIKIDATQLTQLRNASVTPSSVSYTHLDVYKRQALDCVGVPSSSRTWTWMTAAPASYADLASRTISSIV